MEFCLFVSKCLFMRIFYLIVEFKKLCLLIARSNCINANKLGVIKIVMKPRLRRNIQPPSFYIQGWRRVKSGWGKNERDKSGGGNERPLFGPKFLGEFGRITESLQKASVV